MPFELASTVPQFQVLLSCCIASVRSPPIRKIGVSVSKENLLQHWRKYRNGKSEIGSKALPVYTLCSQPSILERERRQRSPAIADVELGRSCVRRRLDLHRPILLNGIIAQGLEAEGLFDSDKGDLGREAGGGMGGRSG